MKKMQYALREEEKLVFDGQNTLELAEAMYQYMLSDIREENEGNKKMAEYYINELVKEVCVPKKTLSELEDTTLGAIAELLNDANQDRCRHIITYNYDNILEIYLRKKLRVIKDRIKVIFKNDCSWPKDDEDVFAIYHVHGCLPVQFSDVHEEEIESESSKIILTESSYYEMEREEYNWTNTIQSIRIQQSSMIYVGFSGQDYNYCC